MAQTPSEKGAGLAEEIGREDFEGIGELPIKAPKGHSSYWSGKGKREGVTTVTAREQICGNCKAFDVSDQMVECGGASEDVVGVICAPERSSPN